MPKRVNPETAKNINYDGLLSIFVGTYDIRPQIKQPNRSGDYVFATDGNSLIRIPVTILSEDYQNHHKAPDYSVVTDQSVACDPVFYSDSSLFKILDDCPKDYQTIVCEVCEGEGTCPHCHTNCVNCDGMGEIEDKNLPMIPTVGKAAVKVGEMYLSPRELTKLQKVILETETEVFSVTGISSTVTRFNVIGIDIYICRLDKTPGDDPFESCQYYELLPIKSKP